MAGYGPAAWCKRCGTSPTVATFAVTSSPLTPSPGGGLGEPSVHVGERHGDAVHLGLAGKVERVDIEVGELAA